jgi:hypothetical protein
MKNFFLENKFTSILFALLIGGYLYLQLFGYSYGDRLPTEVEKNAAYSSGTSHHK